MEVTGIMPTGLVPLTAEQKEYERQRRVRGFQHLKTLCISQMIGAAIMFVVGVATIAFALPKGGFPYVWGGPIFTGVMVFVGAAFGFRACREESENPNQSETPFSIRCSITVHYVLCVTGITFCGLTAGYSIWGLVGCLDKGADPDIDPYSQYCQPHYTANVIMAILGILLGTLMMVTCIYGSVLFCIYRRAYGVKNQTERLVEAQIRALAATQEMMRNQMAATYGVNSPPTYDSIQDTGIPNKGFSG